QSGGGLRRDRVLVCRPLRQESLDEPARNHSAHLCTGGTAGSGAGRGRGLFRLPAGRERIAGARLVLRRPSPADRSRVVVEPPAAAHRRTIHQGWRSTMKVVQLAVTTAVACAGLAALLIYADAGQSLKVDFSDETVGSEPKSFVSVVGVWRIEAEGNNKVLAVDGRQWKEGQTAAGIADKARALYGDRYAEFLDRVQAYAYF